MNSTGFLIKDVDEILCCLACSLPRCIILLRINEFDQPLSSLIQAARFKE